MTNKNIELSKLERLKKETEKIKNKLIQNEKNIEEETKIILYREFKKSGLTLDEFVDLIRPKKVEPKKGETKKIEGENDEKSF